MTPREGKRQRTHRTNDTTHCVRTISRERCRSSNGRFLSDKSSPLQKSIISNDEDHTSHRELVQHFSELIKNCNVELANKPRMERPPQVKFARAPTDQTCIDM